MVLFELLALGAIGFGVRRHMKKKRARKLQKQYGNGPYGPPPPDYYPPPPNKRDVDYSRNNDYEPGYISKPTYAHDTSPHSPYAERPAPSYTENFDVVQYRQEEADRMALERGARDRWAEPRPTKGYNDGYGGQGHL